MAAIGQIQIHSENTDVFNRLYLQLARTVTLATSVRKTFRNMWRQRESPLCWRWTAEPWGRWRDCSKRSTTSTTTTTYMSTQWVLTNYVWHWKYMLQGKHESLLPTCADLPLTFPQIRSNGKCKNKLICLRHRLQTNLRPSKCHTVLDHLYISCTLKVSVRIRKTSSRRELI